VESLVQGNPRDPLSDIGPQVHRIHFERITGFVNRAKADGATIRLGGGQNSQLGGLYFRPTLVEKPTPGSEIVTQEVFGPVRTTQAFGPPSAALRSPGWAVRAAPGLSISMHT